MHPFRIDMVKSLRFVREEVMRKGGFWVQFGSFGGYRVVWLVKSPILRVPDA